MDGRPRGLYAQTRDEHLWWHAEHGTHAIPDEEIAGLHERLAALRAGAKVACPGDLAVLADDRPTSTHHGFHAGTNNSLNRWHQQLCTLALGVGPGEVCDQPARFAGRPFVELIDFDSAGAIGPVTSAKLARDFAAHAAILGERAAVRVIQRDERAYFFRSYADWQRAFELAAQGGFVILG